MTQRLPVPGGDSGDWGDILNGFLGVSHNGDGTLGTNTVSASQLQDNAVTNAKLDSSTQFAIIKANSSVQTVNAVVPNASGNVTLSAADVSAIPVSDMGAASGVATLDSNSTLTASQLPASTVGVSSPADGQIPFYSSYQGKWVGGAATSLQNGIVSASDLAISSISINTSTGALTFTLGSANPCWVKSTSGALVPVNFSGTVSTITPSLPASSNYAVIGVEIDVLGNISLAKGADKSTQLNTGSLIAANTSPTTSGHLRLADFALYNNAGTYQFGDHTTTASQGVNWIDRRPWARGFRGSVTGTGSSAVTIPYRNGSFLLQVQLRAELTGSPIVVNLTSDMNNSTATDYVGLQVYVGGTTAYMGLQMLYGSLGIGISGTCAVPSPSAGSSLVTVSAYATAQSNSVYTPSNTKLTVLEHIGQNGNNGLA